VKGEKKKSKRTKGNHFYGVEMRTEGGGRGLQRVLKSCVEVKAQVKKEGGRGEPHVWGSGRMTGGSNLLVPHR